MTGELPPGWAWATGKDLFTIIRGVTFSKGDARPIKEVGDVTVLRAGNIQDGSLIREDLVYVPPDFVGPDQHLRQGDIVVAMSSGSLSVVGKTAAITTEFPNESFGAFCGCLRPRLPSVGDWLKAFTQTRAYRRTISERAAGVNINNLRPSHLDELPIPVPPLAEQHRIVAKAEALLDRARRAREALEAIPAQLDRYRQSILAAAFRGDLTADWRGMHPQRSVLEAVERTQAPQQPRGGREATDTVIPGVGGMAVNNPDTPLSDGWAWVPLMRIARQETGHTPSRSKPEYWEGGDIPWIGIRDAGAHHGGYIQDTFQHVTALGLENSSARLLPANTVCLSRTASVGYVVIMGRPMATSQDFATWTCTDVLDPEYLMYALLSEGQQIRRFGEGSTHTTIYFPEIRALHIALAPVEEQREIVARVRSALSAVDNVKRIAEEKLANLDTLTQSILAKAFHGELVLQDPEDEPASVLLERIRTERTAAASGKAGRGRRKI